MLTGQGPYTGQQVSEQEHTSWACRTFASSLSYPDRTPHFEPVSSDPFPASVTNSPSPAAATSQQQQQQQYAQLVQPEHVSDQKLMSSAKEPIANDLPASLSSSARVNPSTSSPCSPSHTTPGLPAATLPLPTCSLAVDDLFSVGDHSGMSQATLERLAAQPNSTCADREKCTTDRCEMFSGAACNELDQAQAADEKQCDGRG
ncbi:MAG: hypothetical protein WDW38_010157 [Sanguina aurantia]